jgi:serine/threonine protein phosphatase 1
MAGRTFAIGDVHGDIVALKTLLARLPTLDDLDTLVFLGDYIDRGPRSKDVIEFVREVQQRAPMKVVTLRGNHEDGWLRVAAGGWPEFVLPPGNGCLAAYRSYVGVPYKEGEFPGKDEVHALKTGSFFPPEHLEWMQKLEYFYEDDHAIYVHAGLVEQDGKFIHPKDTENVALLLWVRTIKFFTEYRGKLVVVGHTSTDNLPPELSSFTPEDPLDMWVGDSVIAVDTGCGKGGFLTCVELPARKVYESR